MSEGNRQLVERIFQNAHFVRSLGVELTSFGNGYLPRYSVARATKSDLFFEAEAMAERRERVMVAKASRTIAGLRAPPT